MKTIIAGSRTITDYALLLKIIADSGFEDEITEVVCGAATGVDTMGVRWANSKGIPVKYFYPDWRTYGQKAGPIRNEAMAKYADVAIILWDGKSRGTQNMINYAMRNQLRLYVHGFAPAPVGESEAAL